MDDNEFRIWSHKAADWGVDYRRSLRNLPVRAQTTPGATFNAVPSDAPEVPESMDMIFADFERLVVPRMLSATRKRHAHRLANQMATSVQNGPVDAIQNEKAGNSRSA
jgi:hypothetical protein